MSFLVFAGSTYYPSGGINDLKGEAQSMDEAEAILHWLRDNYQWAQIVDSDECFTNPKSTRRFTKGWDDAAPWKETTE